MLEEKLDNIYQMISRFDFVTPENFSAFKSYYYYRLKISEYLDPYEFSYIYSIDIEDSIRLHITLTKPEIALLKLIPYVDCQNYDCDFSIFLKNGETVDHDEEDFENVLCTECESVFPKLLLQYETKLKFKILPIKPDVKKKSSTTYDILVSNPDLLKLSPPSFNEDTKQSIKSDIGGISLAIAEKLNRQPDQTTISDELALLCRTFSDAI